MHNSNIIVRQRQEIKDLVWNSISIDRDLISEKENEIIVLSHQLPDKYLNQKSNISRKMFPLI